MIVIAVAIIAAAYTKDACLDLLLRNISILRSLIPAIGLDRDIVLLGTMLVVTSAGCTVLMWSGLQASKAGLVDRMLMCLSTRWLKALLRDAVQSALEDVVLLTVAQLVLRSIWASILEVGMPEWSIDGWHPGAFGERYSSHTGVGEHAEVLRAAAQASGSTLDEETGSESSGYTHGGVGWAGAAQIAAMSLHLSSILLVTGIDTKLFQAQSAGGAGIDVSTPDGKEEDAEDGTRHAPAAGPAGVSFAAVSFKGVRAMLSLVSVPGVAYAFLSFAQALSMLLPAWQWLGLGFA